ncbi:MAG: ElyC/SanA/YdcF family protein [Prolixibacteraceae bacterium]
MRDEMGFLVVREVVKAVMTPMAITWILLLAILVFYLAGKKRLSKWMAVVAFSWLMVISTPFVPEYLLGKLENKFPPVTLQTIHEDLGSSKDSIVHVLVLGGGYETDDRLSYLSQLGLLSLGRLAEGIRLHHLLPGSILIFSGFGNNQPLSNAEVSKLATYDLGIDSTFIQTISEPWNTKAEAAEYLKRFGMTGKLYLVTDASHMPRAMMHFSNAGLHPIAAPTNFYIKRNNIPKRFTYYFPSSSSIRDMEIVFNEYLGLLWAKMGGN